MKIISTKNAPVAVGPYSQAIEANGVLYISGQIPFNPKTMKAPEGIVEQSKQSLENVKAILEAAGTSLEKVIKVNVFVQNMGDFEQINEVYKTYFPVHKPARALVEVARLPKDVLIEIEAVAQV